MTREFQQLTFRFRAGCLAAGLGCSAMTAATVPPGFETLLLGQTEQLEVRLPGRSLGLFAVEVKPDTLTFEAPESVLAAAGLQALPEPQQQQALAALSRPLPRHGHLACNGGAIPGCGYVATDSAAVIMDESQGAVLLFLKPEWLVSLKQDQRWMTPTPAAKNAFIHRQTANYSGDSNSQSLSLNGAGALGLGERRYLGGNWAYTWNRMQEHSAGRFWFDNLYARQDLGSRYYLQAGRMDQRNLSGPLGGNFGFTLLPLPRFDGLRSGTTQAYVNPGISRDATPVMVQVSRNARIDVYRGSQLLGSQYFAPGMHSLNSDTFPAGSYPLELRVYEDGVLQRTENQPFSKGGGAFSDQWQWFLQAGTVSPESYARSSSSEQSTSATGVQMALGRNLQLTSGLSRTEGVTYNETRLDAQHALSIGVLSLAVSGLTGSNGSRGDSQQLSFVDCFSASLYRYRVRGAGCGGDGDVLNDMGCYTSLNGSLSIPVAGWSATLGYSDTRSDGRRYRRPASADGLVPAQTLRTAGQRNRAWQLGTARAFNWSGTTVSTRAGVFHNRDGRTSDKGMYLGFTLSRTDNATPAGSSDSYSSAGVDWRNGSGSSQTSYTLNHTRMWQQDTYRELALNFSGYNDDSYSGSAGGRVNGRYGGLTGTLSSGRQRHGSAQTALTSGYSSALALSSDGLFWGGNGGGDPAAGLAVRVAPEEDRGGAALISGGNAHPLTLGFGQSTLLPLDGYQLASVNVRDVTETSDGGVASVTGGAGDASYFLPPGRLLIRDVSARITRVYIGQALGPDGRPLARAQVLNQALPALGDDGGFTLQAEHKVPALWLISDGMLMRCPLTVKTVRDVLQIVGETQCTAAGVEGLPQSLRMTPRVMKLLATAQR